MATTTTSRAAFDPREEGFDRRTLGANAPYTPPHRRTDAPTHRRTDAPTHRHTDVPPIYALTRPPPHWRPRSAAKALKKDYAYAATELNDTAWPLVDAPHDFSIENGTFDPASDFKHGYLPRTTSWYRKHFKLPEEFAPDSAHLELHFQGGGGCPASPNPSSADAAGFRRRPCTTITNHTTPVNASRLLSRVLRVAQRRVPGPSHRWLHQLHRSLG